MGGPSGSRDLSVSERDRPLLIFPEAVVVERSKLSGRGPDLATPTLERQEERLAPSFQRLQAALDAQRVLLQEAVAGEEPEMVIVLEVAGSVGDFFNAVRRIPGAEWLAEYETSVAPDDDFHLAREDHRDRPVGAQLFLIMSDQRAVDEILSLWRGYRDHPDRKFGYGLAKWKTVFAHLHDLRPWAPSDRLDRTGVLEDWQQRIAGGEQRVPTEIELWFRGSPERRDAAEEAVASLVQAQGGEIIASAVVAEIGYHALLAHIPAASVTQLADLRGTRLVRSQDVMFFRAVDQTFGSPPGDDEDDEARGHVSSTSSYSAAVAERSPVTALLDGMPIENHELLTGWLVIDDPDGWGVDYPVAERLHGTAMSSLIVHGELDGSAPELMRPVYVRPILRPDSRDFRAERLEAAPDDELLVDLIHRAVRRLMEGDAEEDPAAPSVRVISLSVCDAAVPFDRFPSPLARLLDWLAARYGLLFIVSAGNYGDVLRFELSPSELDDLTTDELEAVALAAFAQQGARRRVYAPAESINSLTVGASHWDASTFSSSPTQRNLVSRQDLPSPINPIGGGFRRAIKPDVLYPGGRQLYMDTVTTPNSTECGPVNTVRAPGAKVASPGGAAAVPGATTYVRGTSVAAAALAGQAQRLYEAVIEPLNGNRGQRSPGAEYEAIVLKALLAHGASWHGIDELVGSAVVPDADANAVKDYTARLAGYGSTDTSRSFSGDAHRAVLLGWGDLGEDLAHVYEVPLPQSLSGNRVWRRVAVTLAWFSPINASHRAYRRASLWFDVRPAEQSEFGVARQEAQWQTVKRGTLQHEILEGERAAVFGEEDSFSIQVNCRADAGGLAASANYALLVTVETAPELGLPIYDEIALRVRPRVPVTPGTARP